MLTDAVKIRIFYWWQSAQPHRKICAVLRAFTVHIECETKTWINHLYQHWLQSKATNSMASWTIAIVKKIFFPKSLRTSKILCIFVMRIVVLIEAVLFEEVFPSNYKHENEFDDLIHIPGRII